MRHAIICPNDALINWRIYRSPCLDHGNRTIAIITSYYAELSVNVMILNIISVTFVITPIDWPVM